MALRRDDVNQTELNWILLNISPLMVGFSSSLRVWPFRIALNTYAFSCGRRTHHTNNFFSSAQWPSESTLHHHHQNTKWGNSFWGKNCSSLQAELQRLQLAGVFIVQGWSGLAQIPHNANSHQSCFNFWMNQICVWWFEGLGPGYHWC